MSAKKSLSLITLMPLYVSCDLVWLRIKTRHMLLTWKCTEAQQVTASSWKICACYLCFCFVHCSISKFRMLPSVFIPNDCRFLYVDYEMRATQVMRCKVKNITPFTLYLLLSVLWRCDLFCTVLDPILVQMWLEETIFSFCLIYIFMHLHGNSVFELIRNIFTVRFQ